MSKIYQTILNFLKDYPTQPLVIAYSGGVDSQVLLSLIHQLKDNADITNDVTVCHVNHCLSHNADAWQEFARQQCKNLSIHYIPITVSLDLNQGKSIEAVARDARYHALKSISDEPAMILTGHHLDDQAETFLLAMKRGSGVKGLSAMKSISELGIHMLARPMMTLSREEIVDYANSKALNWIEDESNHDNAFDRNFLRNDVIPILTSRWPSIASTISRSAQHCQQSQELLDELADMDYQACVDDKTFSLSISALKQLSSARFNNLFRYYLAKLNISMPSAAQLEQIKQQMHADKEQTPMIILGENVCRRYKSNLYITPLFNDIAEEEYLLDIQSHMFNERKSSYASYFLPDGLGELIFSINFPCDNKQSVLAQIEHSVVISHQVLALKNKDSQLKVAFRHSNPKVLPDYRNHHRSLKKVLQELNIPVWQRTRLPILFFDDEVVAVLGQFVCQPHLPSKNEVSLTVHWLKHI